MSTETTETSKTRRAKNEDGDPDPATLPAISTKIAGPFNIPQASTAAPSPSIIQREANAAYMQGKKELSEILSGLDTGAGKYTLQLNRVTPRVWKGRMISGYLAEYPMSPMPTQEDVKQQHGGGTYFWRIMRAAQNGAPKFGTTTDSFDIAGDPIPPEAPAGSEQQNGHRDGASQIVEIAKMTMEQAQRAAERAEDRAASATKGDGGNSMQMFLNAQEKREREVAEARKAELEALKLKIEAAERERKDELAAAERRRKEERDDAIRIAKEEREEREKRYEKEEKEKDRRHQEMLAKMEAAATQARLDAEARVKAEQEAAKARAEMENKNFQLQLQSMKDSTALQIEAMKSTQTSQMEGYKQLDKMKMDFFQAQLSQKPVDPLDQIEKWSRISDIMSGRDKEEKEPVWKEIVSEIKDAAREAGPSLLAMAGVTSNAIDGARSGDGQERRRKRKQLQGRRRAKPGTVVTADLEEEELPEEAKEETNGLKKLTFPAADETDINVISDLLMRNIDWALEQGNDATWIVNNVVKNFPPIVGAQLAATPVDVIIKQIEERIPDTWKLTSPGGLKIVKEAHAILKKKG